MEITPKDSRYIPLTQQKYCCVPTCIQIVMIKNAIPLISAELIGYHMGLVVPKEDRHLFWNSRIGSKPPAGYGTQIGKKEYGPNAVFKKLKIPLKMTWSLINKFKTIKEFNNYLAKVEGDKDVLVCFDWPTLFDIENENHWGHVCVLDKVYLEKSEIRIIDPSHNVPKWRVVKIDRLFESMKIHGSQKSGGFWELSRV